MKNKTVDKERIQLAQREGQRERYRAIIARFGTKRSFGYESETVLLIDVVTTNGQPITDHIWFTCGKWTSTLKIGDKIEFNARSASYIKGYAGDREDVIAERGYGTTQSYKLANPTKVVTIGSELAYIENRERERNEQVARWQAAENDKEACRREAKSQNWVEHATTYSPLSPADRTIYKNNLSERERTILAFALNDRTNHLQQIKQEQRRIEKKAQRARKQAKKNASGLSVSPTSENMLKS
jgi:hypothetical protein